uniref:ORF12 n=1 Tax=Nitrosopumilaceae spindle-shaped virus TaxID=3065433 RepID=A0AAT9JG47_9VIRU
MTLKHTLENYLGNLVNSDPRVKENLDKLFPNDSTLKEITDNINTEVQTNSEEGEEEKMAKFEKQNSEYISGNDLVNTENVRFEILTEVKEESSNFGMKPKCSVKVSNNGVTTEQKWTLNLQNINFLIDSFGDESTAWVGKSVGVFVENIKGNNAIRVKA